MQVRYGASVPVWAVPQVQAVPVWAVPQEQVQAVPVWVRGQGRELPVWAVPQVQGLQVWVREQEQRDRSGRHLNCLRQKRSPFSAVPGCCRSSCRILRRLHYNCHI